MAIKKVNQPFRYIDKCFRLPGYIQVVYTKVGRARNRYKIVLFVLGLVVLVGLLGPPRHFFPDKRNHICRKIWWMFKVFIVEQKYNFWLAGWYTSNLEIDNNDQPNLIQPEFGPWGPNLTQLNLFFGPEGLVQPKNFRNPCGVSCLVQQIAAYPLSMCTLQYYGFLCARSFL